MMNLQLLCEECNTAKDDFVIPDQGIRKENPMYEKNACSKILDLTGKWPGKPYLLRGLPEKFRKNTYSIVPHANPYVAGKVHRLLDELNPELGVDSRERVFGSILVIIAEHFHEDRSGGIRRVICPLPVYCLFDAARVFKPSGIEIYQEFDSNSLVQVI